MFNFIMGMLVVCLFLNRGKISRALRKAENRGAAIRKAKDDALTAKLQAEKDAHIATLAARTPEQNQARKAKLRARFHLVVDDAPVIPSPRTREGEYEYFVLYASKIRRTCASNPSKIKVVNDALGIITLYFKEEEVSDARFFSMVENQLIILKNI